MKIKIFSIFICLSLLLIMPITTGSTILKEIFQKQNIFNQGEFEAELGVRNKEEPCVILNGQYNIRGRYIIISGTAISGDKQGRFQGILKGSYFILQIPLRGRILNFVGHISFDDDHTTFKGIWRIRGFRATGWIEGILNPRE